MVELVLASMLASAGNSPVLLFAALFLATLALEDAAAVAAGLLAGRMLIDPAVALAALILGTIAGDLALYGAGRWLVDTTFVRRARSRMPAWIEERVRGHGQLAVAAARFIPGTRLPIFLGSGLFRLPFLPTAGVITATTLLWTPILFGASRHAGELALPVGGGTALALAAALVATVLVVPRLLANHPAYVR